MSVKTQDCCVISLVPCRHLFVSKRGFVFVSLKCLVPPCPATLAILCFVGFLAFCLVVEGKGDVVFGDKFLLW